MKVNAFILALAIASVSTLGFFAYVMVSQPEPVKPAATAITTPEELPLTRENLLKLVNEERAKVGVAPLVIDEMLNESAQWKAEDMDNFSYLAHVKPGETTDNGLDYLKGLIGSSNRCIYVGENITGMNDKSKLSAEEAISGWVGFKAHYDAMIDPKYTTTGFGIEPHLAVQHFCQT